MGMQHSKRGDIRNVEGLERELKDLRERIGENESLYRRNEAAVRNHLIEPLLESLGWDPTNPAEVVPEESTERGRPDYTLYQRNVKQLLIEVKNLSKQIDSSEPQKQLVDYAVGEGISFGVLTNGRSWILLKTFEEGTRLSERVIWNINLEEDHKTRILMRLQSIAKGHIAQLSNDVEKEKLVSKALNEIQQSPRALVNPLASIVKEKLPQTESEIDLETIKWFLRLELMEKPLLTETPDSETEGIDPIDAEKIGIQDQVIDITYAKDILVETANYLFDHGFLTISDLPIASGPNRYIINSQMQHKDGSSFTSPEKLNCGAYIETNNSADVSYQYAKDLLEKVKIDKNALALLA